MGKEYQIENVCLFIDNKDCSYRCTWMTSKWLEETRIWLPRRRNSLNWSIFENQYHFLTTKTWDVYAQVKMEDAGLNVKQNGQTAQFY